MFSKLLHPQIIHLYIPKDGIFHPQIPMYLYLLSVALFIQLLSLILITFHILITSNTPRTTKGTVLRRRLRWAAWRYSTGKEASLALPLLLITQHLYKRHSCRLLTWFVVFPEAFLAFAAQVSGAVQETVDLMAVLANEYAALFFSGGSADGTSLFCSVGA